MSDTDESGVVLVEHTDAAAAAASVLSSPEDDEPPSLVPEQASQAATNTRPHAVNIVSIGTKENAYAFDFHNDQLQEILRRVPPDHFVAVVAVVGAFRTGKSFLLSWFLRYLHVLQQPPPPKQAPPEPQAAATSSSSSSSSNNNNDKPWYEQVDSLGNDGFHWKAGSDRDTTGIWMWSQPYVLPTNSSNNNKPLAVLLVDTQGMFDHETTMNLTASIFGFSTLLSSHQVYNVDKRIQEDDLQQLALFSEFAKIAVEADQPVNDETEDATKNVEKNKTAVSAVTTKKPFQKIEFLVRDWQHFDEVHDEDEDDDHPDLERMQQMMQDYLQKVMAERDAKDLHETREQIRCCFEDINCFGLCHPGFAVTKKTFTGNIKAIDPLFMKLLDRFCNRIFNVDQMQPKQIHGRDLTAPELGAYIQAYAQLFASGAKFPEAATLLEATASANNTVAINRALGLYKEEMDRMAGPHCTDWWKTEELMHESQRVMEKSLLSFHSIANFGSKRSIEEARNILAAHMDSSLEVYKSLNDGRNPLAGLETYFIPASVATLAVVLRWFTDLTCSPYSSICRTTSEALSHTSAVVFCFLFIVGATKFKQIKDLLSRLKSAAEVILAPPPSPSHSTKSKRD